MKEKRGRKRFLNKKDVKGNLMIESLPVLIVAVIILAIWFFAFGGSVEKFMAWINVGSNVNDIVQQCEVACTTDDTYGYCSESRTLKATDLPVENAEKLIKEKTANCDWFARKTEYVKYKIPVCDTITCDGNVDPNTAIVSTETTSTSKSTLSTDANVALIASECTIFCEETNKDRFCFEGHVFSSGVSKLTNVNCNYLAYIAKTGFNKCEAFNDCNTKIFKDGTTATELHTLVCNEKDRIKTAGEGLAFTKACALNINRLECQTCLRVGDTSEVKGTDDLITYN